MPQIIRLPSKDKSGYLLEYYQEWYTLASEMILVIKGNDSEVGEDLRSFFRDVVFRGTDYDPHDKSTEIYAQLIQRFPEFGLVPSEFSLKALPGLPNRIAFSFSLSNGSMCVQFSKSENSVKFYNVKKGLHAKSLSDYAKSKDDTQDPTGDDNNNNDDAPPADEDAEPTTLLKKRPVPGNPLYSSGRRIFKRS